MRRTSTTGAPVKSSQTDESAVLDETPHLSMTTNTDDEQDSEREEPEIDVYSDMLLLIDALEREDMTALESVETPVLVNLYTLLSDVQRNANDLRKGKVEEALDVVPVSESDVYDVSESEYVRKAEVDEERKETRLQGLKDRLAVSDDPEADVLRQEVERLEQEIEELTEFSPASSFETQAESG